MNQQVVPLLCEFKDILEGKGSLFLNLQMRGEMNFWGVFCFSSPAPLLFGGFCRKMADDAFCQYSGTLENDALRRMRVHFFDRYFPSCGRCLSSYCQSAMRFADIRCCFYQNMVWLDMMYLFPLFCCRCGVWQNRIPGAVCIFSGGNDRCQFLSGVYAGFVPDLGSWYLDLIFFAAGDPRPKDCSAGCRDSGGGFAFCGDLDPALYNI